LRGGGRKSAASKGRFEGRPEPKIGIGGYSKRLPGPQTEMEVMGKKENRPKLTVLPGTGEVRPVKNNPWGKESYNTGSQL